MNRLVGLAVVLAVVAWAQRAQADPITVFTNETDFLSATSAIDVVIPDSATAFPGTNCGEPDTGRGSSLALGFGSNSVTVSGFLGNDLCTFDAGNTITPFGNTIPDLMIANTIAASGEDDYLLTFDSPVFSVGFRFLTNNHADELLTFYDEFGNLISTADIDALTSTNTRVFLGFSSMTPIGSIVIDTVNGAVQNEGFDQLYVGTTSVPEPSTLLLLGTGLAAVARIDDGGGCRRLEAATTR